MVRNFIAALLFSVLGPLLTPPPLTSFSVPSVSLLFSPPPPPLWNLVPNLFSFQLERCWSLTRGHRDLWDRIRDVNDCTFFTHYPKHIFSRSLTKHSVFFSI